MSDMMERGLRVVLRASRRERFELKDASVGGRGLQPLYRDAEWARIRESAYEDRGG